MSLPCIILLILIILAILVFYATDQRFKGIICEVILVVYVLLIGSGVIK